MVYKKPSILIIVFVLIFTILFSIFTWNLDAAFATEAKEPDLSLYIHGENSNGGPIFHGAGNMGEGLWAPGKTESGTIRIHNNYSQRVKVTNLSLIMSLERISEDGYVAVTDMELYKKYAKNMELTIKKGTMLVFTNDIFNNSFYGMLYDKDNQEYNGYNLSSLDRFNVGKNKYVDLEYTVHMAEEDDPVQDTNGHWAHDCIETLIEHGVIVGYPDNTIRPENYITRAEVAALVARALGLKESTGYFTGYIDDIPEWSKDYVITTTKEGIFTGYPGKQFKANNNITRQEVTAVLMRAFGKELEEEIELKFIDKSDIDNWALEYVKTAVQNDVIDGYPNNTFKPDNYITRAEVFTMLCKLLEYHFEHPQ